MGIYVAEVHGDDTTVIDRYIVVADSAHQAAWKAADQQWRTAPLETRQAMVEDEGRIVVGRLGDYNPGMTGARMSQGAIIAAQRIGQR